MTSVQETDLVPGEGAFATTHWSVVVSATQTSSVAGRVALEKLCGSYWYPLYAYVRRQGHGPEEAKDLTQAFFARLLEKHYLAHADPTRGKFRTFLLTSLQRFLVNEWQKLRALKRGGGAPLVAWDGQETESRYLAELVQAHTP